MTTKPRNRNIEQQIEELHSQAVDKHKKNLLKEALSLYLRSIELDESQPEWIYANAITVSAQTNDYDTANSLTQKAQKLYSDSDEIHRAIGISFHKQQNISRAIESYQNSIELNPKQPEWVYVKLIELLVRSQLNERADEFKQKAIQEFPQSKVLHQYLKAKIPQHNSLYTQSETRQLLKVSSSREIPPDIEHYLDLNINKIRRKLTDSAIIERYQILLEQMLCNINEGNKQMDVDALVHCLAEIKTDIHYLKIKVLNPPVEAVDPQAKQNIELDKIIGLNKPRAIKCELKERIVGSGWYDSEEHGRWTGPGRLSSIVLPYPVAGKYSFEMTVRAEAKSGLLQTLKISLSDRPLVMSVIQKNDGFFPAVVRGEVIIPYEQSQSFLAVDLTVDETIIPHEVDTRMLGLLVENICLIPDLNNKN